jgi:hypothetical protein
VSRAEAGGPGRRVPPEENKPFPNSLDLALNTYLLRDLINLDRF